MEEKACGLELPPGLHVDYKQKFIKAKPETHPCNYEAQKVPENDKAMRMSLGK